MLQIMRRTLLVGLALARDISFAVYRQPGL